MVGQKTIFFQFFENMRSEKVHFGDCESHVPTVGALWSLDEKLAIVEKSPIILYCIYLRQRFAHCLNRCWQFFSKLKVPSFSRILSRTCLEIFFVVSAWKKCTERLIPRFWSENCRKKIIQSLFSSIFPFSFEKFNRKESFCWI